MIRLEMDMTGVASLATGILLSAYGADRFQVIPKMLNMNPYTVDFTEQYHQYSLSKYSMNNDDTSDIIYHAYLGIEYLYNYKFDEYSTLIDTINTYILETFNVDVDILKYVVPSIKFLNGRELTEYEKYFCISRNDRPLNNFNAYLCKDILTG